MTFSIDLGTAGIVASFLSLLVGCMGSFFTLRSKVQELDRQVRELAVNDIAMETSLATLAPKISRIETLVELLVKRSGLEEGTV